MRGSRSPTGFMGPKRSVSRPRAAITSWDIAPTPPDSGVFLDGYAIAQARLFHVTAETPLRWISSEVEINLRGEPQAVWLDQGRGRVGFADGRVFSLPSRVLVAPQLPEVNPQALVYLNRLSDLLFVLARAANDNGKGDVLWTPGKGQ